MKSIHQTRLKEAEDLWKRRLEQRVAPHKETYERMKGKVRELEEQIASLKRARSETGAENHELQARIQEVERRRCVDSRRHGHISLFCFLFFLVTLPTAMAIEAKCMSVVCACRRLKAKRGVWSKS